MTLDYRHERFEAALANEDLPVDRPPATPGGEHDDDESEDKPDS